MKQNNLKKEVEKAKKIKGEVRGIAPKSHLEFILKEKGEDGLKILEDKIAELGYPIKYKKMRAMDFYPLALEVAVLLALKELFNFDEKKFRELGAFGSKHSLIMRVFMKYFVSLKLTANQTPKMWRGYYTTGDLKVTELDEKKKYLVMRVENFALHPLHCQVLRGYFPSVTKMIVKSPVSCEERRCIFEGDSCHEFLLKW
jgi:hypothetical protein